MKFHIGRNGTPSICRSKSTDTCPLGGEHFQTKEEAQAAIENSLTQEYGQTSSLKKKRRFDETEHIKPIKIEPVSRVEVVGYENIVEFSQDELEFINTIYDGEIPESVPNSISSSSNSSSIINASFVHSLRQQAGSWATVTTEFIKKLKAHLPSDAIVLDPMAGKGFLAKGLRDSGVPTIVTDDNSFKESQGIERLDAIESLKKYGNDASVLLISWAPYSSDIDSQLLKEARTNYPHLDIIVIGEKYGCTGSDEFWDNFEAVGTIEYSTLKCLHDRCYYGK